MRLRLLRFGVMLFGAFHGWVVFVIVLNAEDWNLYSLRSAITGERAMVNIASHPADKWIGPGVMLALCTFGATVAAVTLEIARHVRKPATM